MEFWHELLRYYGTFDLCGPAPRSYRAFAPPEQSLKPIPLFEVHLV